MIPRLFSPDDEPSAQEPQEPTVALVVAQYLEQKELQHKAGMIQKEAVKQAAFYCGAFARDFGDLLVSQCRRGDLKRFLTLHPEYERPFTKADATGAIVTCFRWAEEDGLIDRCPYARPRDLPACEPRLPIKPEEVRAILNHVRHAGYASSAIRFRLGVWFLWETGCRTIEMYRVQWQHYDDERGVFELPSKSTHKTGRKRLIVLSKRAWRLVRFLRRWEKKDTGHVFPNGRGKPWNRGTFGKMFRERADAAGARKEITAYCLRHGFTCESLEAGVGERQLADLLGQSSTRYISWYGRGVKTRVEYLRRAYDRKQRKREGEEPAER